MRTAVGTAARCSSGASSGLPQSTRAQTRSSQNRQQHFRQPLMSGIRSGTPAFASSRQVPPPSPTRQRHFGSPAPPPSRLLHSAQPTRLRPPTWLRGKGCKPMGVGQRPNKPASHSIARARRCCAAQTALGVPAWVPAHLLRTAGAGSRNSSARHSGEECFRHDSAARRQSGQRQAGKVHRQSPLPEASRARAVKTSACLPDGEAGAVHFPTEARLAPRLVPAAAAAAVRPPPKGAPGDKSGRNDDGQQQGEEGFGVGRRQGRARGLRSDGHWTA